MTSMEDQNKAIVTRFNKEFIEGGDTDVFTETISPDFINHHAQQGTPPGPDGAAHFFNQILRTAFPDLTVTIHDQVAEGDKVVTRKTYEATHHGAFLGVAPTGRKVTFGVIDIIKLKEGRYVEHWVNADMLGLLGQLNNR